MQGIKEKLIGFVLIVVGILPFLLKIQSINTAIGKSAWLLPGGIVYQIIIILLGIMLLLKKSYY